MSCPNLDWKGYVLGELDKNARAQGRSARRYLRILPRGVGRDRG